MDLDSDATPSGAGRGWHGAGAAPLGWALVGVAAALGLTWLLKPLMAHNPMVFFLVAVAISSWYGGLRVGLTATAGSVVALYGLLLEPGDGLWLSGYAASRLGLFTGACVLLAWFSERRRRAERARLHVDKTFAELLESASEAIVIADDTGRIVRVNRSAESMFGYGRDELVGEPVERLIPSALRERHVHHRESYMAAPRNRAMGAAMDLRAQRKDGSELPVEISLSHVRDGERMMVMSFITDISARKEAEASLERYQERLRQLAFESLRAEHRERRRIAVDLHDRIGQSLALCQIKLGTLRDAVDESRRDDLDACVRLVQESIDDTRTLTFELSPPVLYDLGLIEAVRWLADQMREQHGLEVDVEASHAPPLEDELASLVFRSVRELLMNAVKHAGVDRAVVRIVGSDEGLQIEVADQGAGFDVEAATQREASGAGGARFGLFSIREQIGRVGGELAITAAPGHGTRVRLRVPLAEHSAAAATEADAEAGAQPGTQQGAVK